MEQLPVYDDSLEKTAYEFQITHCPPQINIFFYTSFQGLSFNEFMTYPFDHQSKQQNTLNLFILY